MRSRPIQLVAAGAAMVGAGEIRAQPVAPPEEGPVVVGERREAWRLFELRAFQPAFEFFGRSRSDTLEQPGEPKVKDTELLLRESLDLYGQAYIGHRNLVDLTGRLSLGIEDRFIDSDSVGTDEHNTDNANLYDLNAHVLGASFVPFDLYTRRDEQLLDRDFSTSITTTTTESGAIATVRSAVAPTTFRLFRLETAQEDQLGQFEYGFDQNTFAAQSNILAAENHRLEVAYTFDDITEQQVGFFRNQYERHDLSLADTYVFGAKRHELRSFLRWYDQNGTPGLEVLRLDEQLLLLHSLDLETRYSAVAERATRNGVEQDLLRGTASVRHELFDSLVSTGTVGAQTLSSSGDFQSDEAFAQGRLEYTKRVPLGVLEASAGLAFNTVENSARGGVLLVIDEPHVFNDPLPIILNRRNIVPGSVVVTGATGFPTYVEGIDYTASYFPDRAEINVIVGGGITNGQTVLVDYDVGPEPGSTIDTIGTGSTVRYTLSEGALQGLSVYAAYRTQDHSLDAADPSRFVLDDTRNLIYGVEFRRGGVRLLVEQENHDSTVNPYDSTRFEAFYDRLLGVGSTLGFDATHELIDYALPENRVSFSRVGARWIQRVDRNLELNLRLDYRDERDDLSGDSRGFDQRVGVFWRKNQTTVSASFKNTMLDGDTSDTSSQVLEVTIRRNF